MDWKAKKMRELEQFLLETENKINNPIFLFSLRKVVSLLSNRDYFQQETQHVIEVCTFANELLEFEGVTNKDSRNVVLVASAIHDVGRFLEGNFVRRHSEVDLNSIAPFISPQISKEHCKRILNCVQRHSTSSKIPPSSLEEKIVFDADNLTIFTNFGYKRWFFKAEDWGHVKDLTQADQTLKQLFELATRGEFFYLESSQKILVDSFYSRISEQQ